MTVVVAIPKEINFLPLRVIKGLLVSSLVTKLVSKETVLLVGREDKYLYQNKKIKSCIKLVVKFPS